MAHTEKIYHHRVVRICELAGDEGVLRNLAFEDCEIRGPAVLVLQATRPDSVRLHNNSFEGNMDAILWEINPEVRPEVIGAILCVDCTFDTCNFTKVGLAGPPEIIQSFRSATGAG